MICSIRCDGPGALLRWADSGPSGKSVPSIPVDVDLVIIRGTHHSRWNPDKLPMQSMQPRFLRFDDPSHQITRIDRALDIQTRSCINGGPRRISTIDCPDLSPSSASRSCSGWNYNPFATTPTHIVHMIRYCAHLFQTEQGCSGRNIQIR
ncbi:hypothetical protein BJ165DRAFT_1424561 [Panaeolus papilionaceus]|nr:hypothetical protein BJ165DRAFT_1424561 [Panaeolus papilionaceus]